MVRRTFERLAALALLAALSAPGATAQEAAPAAPQPAAQAPAPMPGIEEIIVTSRLREESIQDVPLSVQQFGQEAIEAMSPSSLRDFDGLAPNMFIGMNAAGPGASAIFIRGLGYADIEKTQTPNVGVVIDGVFVPSSTGQLIDTFDIETIEVNRGPQAILWGRNTSGGTIVVRRGRPQLGEWGAKLLTTYGDYNGEGDGGAFKVQAVANVPLTTETLALRVGYTMKDEDGFSINELDGKNRGAVDYNAINAKILWEPTETLSVLFNWDWIEDRSDIGPQDPLFDGDDPYVNRSDRVPTELAPYNVSVMSLEANYDLPWGMKFTSISAYWDSHDLVYQDFDGGFANPADWTQNDPNSVFSRLHTRREQEYDVFSQELRLAGTLFEESLTYTLGFYYARDDHDHSQRTEQQLQVNFGIPIGGSCAGLLAFGFPIDGAQANGIQWCAGTGAAGNPNPESFSYQRTFLTNKSWALFGSAEYELPWVEGLRINFGLRYIDEQKDFATRFDNIDNAGTIIGTPVTSETFCSANGNVAPCKQIELGGQKGSWDDVVFEAGASYQVMDNLLTYYRYAQGFRSGGFSLRGSQPTPTPGDPRSWSLTFDPEGTDSHEVGLKSTWFDGRLVSNFAAFYNIVENGQGASIISGITPVGTNTLVLNGGRAEIYGVEFQGNLEVLEGLNFDFTLGWQHGEMVKATQSSHNLAAPAPAADTLCNLISGLPQASQNESTCPVVDFHNNDVARTPELTWGVGLSYRRSVGPGEIVLGSRIRHNDFFWIIPPSIPDGSNTATNTPVGQEGYTLVDANISYEFQVMERSLRVGFVGRNLTDKQYKEQALPLGQFGFQGWGPPRYLGGELQIEL